MERRRCAHCGHPSPPASPTVSSANEASQDARRISPASTIQAWDLLDSSSHDSLPLASDDVVVEPNFASDIYRPLWDFLGLTVISMISLVLYFFLSPDSFPWYLVVTGFFILVWVGYHIIRTYGNEELTAELRRDALFELHTRLGIAVCVFCTLVWLLVQPWSAPWFIFAFSGFGLLLTLHYAFSYLDWKRLWLYPQLQIYVNASFTCYVANTFYGGPSSGAWWLWPTCVWGTLLILQFIVFIMITNRRIRLAELDVEAHTPTISTPKRNLHLDAAEVPLLTNYPLDLNTPLPVSPNHNLVTSSRAPHGRHSRNASADLPRSGRLVPPILPNHGVCDAPLVWMPPQEEEPESFDTDGDSVALVECVSTPPPIRRARTPISTPHVPTKPMSMRVIHHDDHTADVVENSLATPDGGVYIDVVHIPPTTSSGFG